MIRKFVSFSGIGETAPKSHFGSLKIKQHIYLALFVVEVKEKNRYENVYINGLLGPSNFNFSVFYVKSL